jgi:mRNA interferase ChpB
MRPVLVVSPDAFNKLTKAPIVVPITSGGNFARLSGFTVELIGSKTMGVVRCDQPRALDLGARKAKKLERVSAEVMDDVLAKLITLIS